MQRQTPTSKSSSEKFGRKSQREMFLERVEQVVPWKELLALLEPHYPEAGSSQTPAELSIMLRTYLVQQWFHFSDSGTEEALYESPVLRSFVGADLEVAATPDEGAIGEFRHILEEHNLDGELLARVNHQLDAEGILIPPGSNADAVIQAPSSTWNGAGVRGWQMPQAEENGQRHIMADAHNLPEFMRGDDLSFHPNELRSLAGDTESAETPEPGSFSYQGQAEAQDKIGGRTKSKVTERSGPSLDALSIAVISPDHRRRYAAASALGECQSGPIREFTSYPPNLDDVPQTMNHNFDVIIVDLDSDPEYALRLVESISVHGLATVIVYSEQTNPELLLRCMRAGAREFLTLPFEPGAMARALARASALRSAVRPAKKTAGRLLVFLSAKGGAGVTTLACNFAVSLAQESKQKTLLIDLNLPLGDAAINLGIRAEHSIVSALQNSSRLDSSFLATLLVKHNSGLFVLAAPSELAPTHVSEEAINKLLEVARESFDYVVVDAGSRLDLQHTHLFDESTTIYLITQVGIAELRNSNRLVSRLSTAGGPKLEIVINRYDPRSLEIAEEHVTKALTRPAQWKIPNNYAAVRRMQNTAVSLMEGDSQISRAIQEMTRSVCGHRATPEKKKGFSFFR
jgi:pilus assembly protein CpaE